ncbi:nicotinate (nicotinamide) nucleotide adenylyltransferase [Candidatus Gottesmanbacteria bacterium RIFOXYB1_FULL_47_11]|uniref:Probable nicotinate-nucleotide adenylyltransferase n=1 Tax=Candidatus Gottesmanbacteria bacterium RIFOXYB1_FULL_47_11 TaxID=1798401 RepID=A0A1F6BDN7_9BACT|nr:MAG: nicotinate (nicotinamide) nucleotide adenylyltransferase [Candidatus Gottesmanbacteria bacterium RIFOXYB1_FULL_47_11]
MHIGLFGGVFNPPHIGHLMIAQQVLDYTDIEEIWFIPNYGQQPPKAGVAPVGDRLAMARMLTLPHTKVSTIEIDNQLSGYTIDLLPFLLREHTYTFIMGSDWLPGFTKWKQWEELLTKLPFLVFPRNDHPTAPLYKNMTLLAHPDLITSNISSTKIRARIAAGLPIDQFVPAPVAEYIKTHELYTS